MIPYFKNDTITVYNAEVMDGLAQLQDESVQCVVTSPPYFGLRDYGVDGQLGLEKTPEEYVEKMVAVFMEVHRVLKKDGVLWLNMGDSYSRGKLGRADEVINSGANGLGLKPAYRTNAKSLKPKNLIGIPWRIAFALQSEGWIIRQDIIWAKPGVVPESVTDRCTKSHEYIFLLTKSGQYFYDHEAIKEKAVWDVDGNGTIKRKERQNDNNKRRPGTKTNGIRKTYPNGQHKEGQQSAKTIYGKRNKRDVWTVATISYPGSHFAVFPPALIEPCILAGSRPGDIVLDPFWGSGTTGEVAVKHSRKAIGIELNQDYCELSLKRFKQNTFSFI